MTVTEVAKCRGCGRPLRGKPYHQGGSAYIPETGKRAPVNHYGGFVCSYNCDWRACIELESSMPGAGPAARPGSAAMESIRNNWPRTYR